MADKTTFKFLPLTISLETKGSIATPLVHRGTPLPTKRQQRFSTAVDNQNAVSIEICLGESPIATKNIRVGKVELAGITEAPAGQPEIDVTFEVDTLCKVKVTAKEKKSGKIISSEAMDLSSYLTNEKVQEMLRKTTASRQEDETAVQQINARNNANNLILRAEKYLQGQQQFGLANAADKQIAEMIASLGLSLQEDDLNAIGDKSKRLEQLVPATTVSDFGDFGKVFDDFFGPSARKQTRGRPVSSASKKSEATDAHAKKQVPQSEEVAESKKGLFSAGQHFDAKFLVRDLFAQADHEILVIDGYVGEDVLSLLTVKRDGVRVKLLTGKVSQVFLTLARDFNRQYKGLELRSSNAFHDRFIIIDAKHFYHFGASLEHLGNKTFMFSKLEEPLMTAALQKHWVEAWDQAPQAL